MECIIYMKPQLVYMKTNVHYPNVNAIILTIPGQYQQNMTFKFQIDIRKTIHGYNYFLTK